MKTSSDSRQSMATVASHVRGRLRVKFDHQSRSKAHLEHIEQYLEAQPGIGDVVVNAATGSMTIPYDHTNQDHEGVFRFLEDLDVVVESTLHPPSVEGVAPKHGHPSLSDAVDDLNAYVHRTMGVPVNLRLVLPLGLLAAGVWSIARRGLLIEDVPGWVFLWLAFDTFVKMHPEHAPAPHPVRRDDR